MAESKPGEAAFGQDRGHNDKLAICEARRDPSGPRSRLSTLLPIAVILDRRARI